jgi:hypothetical protein
MELDATQTSLMLNDRQGDLCRLTDRLTKVGGGAASPIGGNADYKCVSQRILIMFL